MFALSKDSPKPVSTGLALLIVGLMMIVCSTAWQHVFAPMLHLSAGMNDFARGFCIGLGLTLELGALAILARHLPSRDRPL